MIRDMRTILMRLFTVALLMMVSMAAGAQYVTVNIEKDGDFGNGSITEKKDAQSKSADGNTVTVTLIVKPKSGYSIDPSTIEVYETISPQTVYPNGTRANDVTLGKRLDVKCDVKTITKETECTIDVASNLGVWVQKAEFLSGSKGNRDVTYTYYAIHNKDKGYLKQAKGAVANDATFRSGHIHDDNGYSIWVLSSSGYLQQEMYYLNVANGQTLYLSTTPVTQWDLVDDSDKKRLQMRGSIKILGLNDATPVLKEPAELTGDKKYKYAACEMTITESDIATSLTDVSFTVQSPQLVSYLRTYYTRKITATILKNDNGDENKIVAENANNRCYCLLTYNTTSDTNKGNTWDINTATGVIYSKQASGDVNVVATYDVAPLDPLASHPSTTSSSVTLKLQPSPFAPDAAKNYLLYYTKDANYRFPYDDGTLNEDDPVKTNATKNVLTEPLTNPNTDISWKVVRDNEGFYSFQNVKSSRWLRFDENHYISGSDYGVVEMGATGTDVPTGTEYKFRLYKSGTYGSNPTYCILPFSKQYAVFKSDGVLADALTSLNVYTTPKVISLWKAGNDSKYCIFAYEAEYRIYGDFTLTGPNSAVTTGDYVFNTTESYSSRNIKGSPANNRDLEIKNSYSTDIGFNWQVTDVGGNDTAFDTYISKNTSVSSGKGTLTVTVNSLPTGPLDGKVRVQAKSGSTNGGIGGENNQKWSGWKEIQFNLYGEPSYTDISSLSGITSSDGYYRLIADASDAPGVTEFNGYLDGNMHKITSTLSSPLFTTLTGTVKNLILENVNISSHEGNTGAIACTASGSARIYNVGILGGSVGGTGYTGGLVGFLDDEARVVNCFSYADITGGTKVGGIVGYNNVATTSSNLKTMVMNCMFYGDITGGNDKAPIYNGKKITNRGDESGVSNFNYFRAEASYVQNKDIQTYNCALMAETRFLQRFEFFRHLLNSHRELAAWWATGAMANKDLMAKWVMEPEQIGSSTPYPILKTPGRYRSVVYIDDLQIDETNHTGRSSTTGSAMNTLAVTIEMGSGGAQFGPPTGAEITTSSLTLNITDKDPDHYNFNYYKVQLPYYNDVGTKNYTGNRVVTGWKIVSITGGTPGSFKTGDYATVDANGNITESAYNFADRNCTDKDKYSVSGRVFNQGAYWDVPEGVTAITIQPYWAKCAYLADPNADKVYNKEMGTGYDVPNVGGGQIYTNGNSYPIAGENQMVFTDKGKAIATSNSGLFQGASGSSGHTVYDYAVVLVGNYHFYGDLDADMSKPYTVTSVDLDGDNEPDYSYILRFDSRKKVHPVRVDFINIPGLGMAQKSYEGTGSYNFGIMQPKGWFESTNTSLFRETQFEYDNTDRIEAPYILQGGVMEQWVSGQSGGAANKTTYFHVGGNVWFKEFHRGTHQDYSLESKHPPVSVTGGDFDEFYLTGLYKAVTTKDDNAECYISGGRFGIVAGTGMEGIGDATNHTKGNITWQISYADIKEFYGGGINAKSPVQGNITTNISGSHVKTFCGGPKFGDMWTGRTVKTTATNCEFGTYFGAGYGGNSYSRQTPYNYNNKMNIDWNKWVKGEIKAETDNNFNGYKRDYKKVTSGNRGVFEGVSTQFSYQFLPMSGNKDNCARLFIDYVMFSLATTHGITSNLTGCTVTGNFYGGGSLGKVEGDVTSTLDGCAVLGNVFGAGFSANLPPVEVDSIGFRQEPYYYEALGTYRTGVKGKTTTYTWVQNSTMTNPVGIDPDKPILYTKENLAKDNLGSVAGNVTLTIKGNSVIGTAGDTSGTKGNVFGGGESSYVTGDTHKVTVNLQGNTQVLGNVFGGGDEGVVQGSVEVNIEE